MHAIKNNRLTRSRHSYAYILRLSVPIMVQNLFSAAISSTDIIMLNQVGQSSISAVSLATQYSSILFMIYYGLGSGITMLCAQYWGKKDLRAINQVEGIALRFSILVSVLFALPCIFCPDLMMKLFTNDSELISIGASYLRIISVSYLCWGISEMYLTVLRSVERVKISTLLNISALILNIFLNAVFIFGLFHAPKLGAAGVALATSLSRAIQLAACFLVSSRSKDVTLKLSFLFQKSGILLQDFIHLSLPALANDIVWSVGFAMYSAIMGHIGSDIVAANSLVVVVRNFGTVMCYATANASGICVGKQLGAGLPEQAKEDASCSLHLTIGFGILGGLIVAAVTPLVLANVSLTDTARGYLKIMLFINTYYILGTAVNSTLIAGVFRAGGDSRFGFLCDTIDMWCYGVPLGFLAAFVFHFPPMVVYFLLCTDEFVKWPWVIKHYKSMKWLKNITRTEY